MARGWGKSEEDLGAEREQAREERARVSGRREDARREAQRRAVKLSLARIEQQLPKVKSPHRRGALEAARKDLLEKLERL